MNGVLLLADARFPAGGHAHSAGTEAAVRCGDVHDIASLERFLAGRLATSGVVDAAFAAQACHAADELVGRADRPDEPARFDRLDRLDGEYEARIAAPRLRAVSHQLGRQMARAGRAVWPHPALQRPYHQPIVLGVTCAAAGGSPDDAVRLATHHLAGAITTAAVRMLGLDPTAAARAHAHAAAAFVDDPGWATCDPADLPAVTGTLAEILAEDHGRWDARLFVA